MEKELLSLSHLFSSLFFSILKLNEFYKQTLYRIYSYQVIVQILEIEFALLQISCRSMRD